ncbi:MAG: MFS transporter [Thermodesulfobacteriota bacterium]|nr:MFS transporter [Thermodesulfobacteriota bacterium]
MKKSRRFTIFYGWFVVLGSFLAIFSAGQIFSYGVFFDTLRTEFGWNYAVTSSIHSLSLILSLIFMIAWGPIIDKYGSKIPLFIAALSSGIGFILVSQSQNLWHFYVFRAVGCIGAATMPAALSAVQKWFIKKRGLVVAIAITGLGVGQFFYPVFSEFLITNYNWRIAFITMGFFNASLLLLSSYLIIDSPEKKGLLPDGAQIQTSEDAHTPKDTIHGKQDEWALWEALKTPSFIALSLYGFVTVIPIHIAYVHLVPFILKTDFAPLSTASISLSIIGGMSIVGRLLFGVLTPHTVEWRQGLCICSAICGIMMLWLSKTNAFWMIWIFSFIFGTFQGGNAPLVPGIIGTYYGTKSLASLLALSNATMMLGAATGPMLAGFICDHTGTYTLAFLAGAFFYLVGLLSILKITPPKKQD